MENQKAEDILKREMYESSKKLDDLQLDPETKQMVNNAKVEYLVPDWADQAKLKYHGIYTHYQRFGNQDTFKQNYINAIDRHEKDVRHRKVVQDQEKEEMEDGIQFEN